MRTTLSWRRATGASRRREHCPYFPKNLSAGVLRRSNVAQDPSIHQSILAAFKHSILYRAQTLKMMCSVQTNARPPTNKTTAIKTTKSTAKSHTKWPSKPNRAPDPTNKGEIKVLAVFHAKISTALRPEQLASEVNILSSQLHRCAYMSSRQISGMSVLKVPRLIFFS